MVRRRKRCPPRRKAEKQVRFGATLIPISFVFPISLCSNRSSSRFDCNLRCRQFQTSICFTGIGERGRPCRKVFQNRTFQNKMLKNRKLRNRSISSCCPKIGRAHV